MIKNFYLIWCPCFSRTKDASKKIKKTKKNINKDWSYELSDFAGDDSETVAFDSYMVPESDLELGQLRLLEVDNRLVLPVNTHLRVIVTATDVLHDWAVPALGIKVDACPGRLNQVSTLIQRTGVYYGQCSELCGAYHAFMPIVIEATDLVSYLAWLKSQG